ncbi:MAG: hypothetical protein ABR583_14480 [Gaiellaceae bacterium]
MRRTLAIGVVLLAGLVLAASAGAATPTERKLQRQVGTLQTQVKKLQKDVKKLQKDVKTAQLSADAAAVLSACSTSLAADAFQGTWNAINARFAPTVVFPAEAAVNDAGTCAVFKVARTPTANPPNLTPFKALLSIFASIF